MLRRFVQSIAMVGLAVLAACGSEGLRSSAEALRSRMNPVVPADTIPEMADYAADLAVNIAEMKKLPSGVLFEDLAPGAGDSLVPGDLAEVRYVAWLANGTPVDSGEITFRLGAGDVIPGWDFGVAGMMPGGKRKLVLPPSLAYGPEGAGPVPPLAILVFDVELLSVRR
jgi:FKBP-type peptidyl-prolyl cis-trans isomerase